MSVLGFNKVLVDGAFGVVNGQGLDVELVIFFVPQRFVSVFGIGISCGGGGGAAAAAVVAVALSVVSAIERERERERESE